MANDELAGVDDSGDEAELPIREPMKELKRWPNACHADRSCKIRDVTYPAPTELDAADVLWWIDYTQARANASRSLVNALTGAFLAVMFGSFVTIVGAVVLTIPWLDALAGGAAVVGLFLVVLRMLSDSEHKPFEQRYLLYRQRARDLSVL